MLLDVASGNYCWGVVERTNGSYCKHQEGVAIIRSEMLKNLIEPYRLFC